MFEDLLGSSFLFSKADKQWETLRKACAHAFYKDRLIGLIEVALSWLLLKQEKLTLSLTKCSTRDCSFQCVGWTVEAERLTASPAVAACHHLVPSCTSM